MRGDKYKNKFVIVSHRFLCGKLRERPDDPDEIVEIHWFAKRRGKFKPGQRWASGIARITKELLADLMPQQLHSILRTHVDMAITGLTRIDATTE